MSDVEAAWVGAMLEGEGSLYTKKPGNYAEVIIYSSDAETIGTILRLVGDGNVFGTAPGRTGIFTKKWIWCWRLSAQKAVVAFLPQILSYLTSKRDKAEILLEALAKSGVSCDNSICRRGHDTSILGFIPTGGCRKCYQETQHRYKVNHALVV